MPSRLALARERTRIASERTLMAWVRTAVALIGFGFSIPRFFQYLEQVEGVRIQSHDAVMLGLALVLFGTLSIGAGMVQHVRLMAIIDPSTPKRGRWSFAFVLSIGVGLIGACTFYWVLRGLSDS